MHARAAAGTGVDVYLMPEHGQHPSCEVEADAGGLAVCAAIVAGIAALEHARQIFRGDADARVGDDRWSFSTYMEMEPSGVYLTALESSCSTQKPNHFSSVSTCRPVGCISSRSPDG